jgi:hypothetical protein
MECYVRREAGPWSCQVSLRFRYDSFGNELDEPSSVTFGPALSTANGVESRLRLAQLAILNPHDQPTDFLTKSRDDLRYYSTPDAYEKGQLKFSQNSVCVDIRDSEAVDLSFTDMPGMLAHDKLV